MSKRTKRDACDTCGDRDECYRFHSCKHKHCKSCVMDMHGKCCDEGDADEIPDYVDDDHHVYQISYKNSVLAGFENKAELAAWLGRPGIADMIRAKTGDIDCYSANSDDKLYLHDRGDDDEYHCASEDAERFVEFAIEFSRDD